MRLESQNILFFLRANQHGGTENVVLQLCEILNPLVNKIIVVSADGFSKEKLMPMGIKHYCIPDIEDKSIKNIKFVIKAINKIVYDEKITVIHTHHRMAAFYIRITRLYKRCVFINTCHNTFYNKKVLTRYAYQKANLVACGKMVKKNLNEVFGINNVTVIHNAVKPFDGNRTIDSVIDRLRRDGKVIIGNIGRLSEQKGMKYFIQAIPNVISVYPNTSFIIIGNGEEEEELKKMSEGLPIYFLGYRTDIQNIITQLDFIVLSSLWEGLPLTPIEAFSVGKTVVATGVDGTLEIVKDKENGVLVKPKDSSDLAEGINWILKHPEQRIEMEKRAKTTFEEQFSFETLSKNYIDYYRSL